MSYTEFLTFKSFWRPLYMNSMGPEFMLQLTNLCVHIPIIYNESKWKSVVVEGT